ncbi:hypothetical protein HHK36_000563 [Tetracentron sinense]|uniref:Uncharacterized protein n=1 Tax=Tetracentron sinense TaxID=13715 RepID=A0A835DTY0_TETSI|nr:hypothetical protein HHK36_000563 [Tetracentron sinense]
MNLRFSVTVLAMSDSDGRNLTPHSTPAPFSGVPPARTETLKLNPALLQFAASSILFFSFSAQACMAASGQIPAVPSGTTQTVQEERIGGSVNGEECSMELKSENHVTGKFDIEENMEDKELKAALERWKSKTYALTVPLKIVALRGSVPPSWVKDFVQVQGRRLKLHSEFRGSLMDIFSDLSTSFSKGILRPRSAVTADIVTVGDSWLNFAINKAMIEPIQDVEGEDWFKGLNDKWKDFLSCFVLHGFGASLAVICSFLPEIYLRRNDKGELDSEGQIWAAPYRWGSMVIAYKKSKFQKHNMAPMEDWRDLWRPELAGKISMVDSPREIVGAVLKYMGASYNTNDIDSQITGGKNAARQNLDLLQKQVRLFDSVHYLKAFGVGDVWVAVGWSSDVLPAAKRMSNVAVIVPKSGASLWADLWAIPAASRFATKQIGGRVRGPSPLINQWIEFCLQSARALPFKQEVIPGASPFALEDTPVQGSTELTKGKPKLDTNLIAGVPPPEILAKCEFLEPLSESALKDYQWLIASMQEPDHGLINKMQHYFSSMIRTFRLKLQSR